MKETNEAPGIWITPRHFVNYMVHNTTGEVKAKLLTFSKDINNGKVNAKYLVSIMPIFDITKIEIKDGQYDGIYRIDIKKGGA